MQSTEQRTTHFLRDILRQPKELKQTLDDLSGTGRRALDAAEGALAREAQIAIVVPVAMDHAISVNTYTTLALAAGIVASSVIGRTARNGCPTGSLADSLSGAFAAAGSAIPGWQ